MKKLMVSLAAFLLSVTAFASSCPTFTNEQKYLLSLAKQVGSQNDPELYEAIGDTVGFTQAAVCWKEGFVGEHIIRFRSSDGALGSYGLCHVQLTTSFHMRDIPNTWANRDDHAPILISQMLTNDTFAIQESYAYLRRMIINNRSLWTGVRSYNGAGPRAEAYAEDIKNRVNTLILCQKSVFG